MIVLAYVLLAIGAAAIAAILRTEQLNRRKHRRWMTVHTAANERRDEDILWQTGRSAALRAAMTITVSRYTDRLADLIEDRLATAPPEQHLFLPDPLPVEHVGLRVVQ